MTFTERNEQKEYIDQIVQGKSEFTVHLKKNQYKQV